MKTVSIVVLMILLGTLHLYAQDGSTRIITHRAWVTLSDGTKLKGILYAANKEGIVLTRKTINETIAPNTITIIKIRRKGDVGNGALIGAASGAVFGIASGLMSGDDDSGLLSFSKEEKAIIGAVILVPIGTGIGALIKSGKIRIPINGSLETYMDQLSAIQGYCLN